MLYTRRGTPYPTAFSNDDAQRTGSYPNSLFSPKEVSEDETDFNRYFGGFDAGRLPRQWGAGRRAVRLQYAEHHKRGNPGEPGRFCWRACSDVVRDFGTGGRKGPPADSPVLQTPSDLFGRRILRRVGGCAGPTGRSGQYAASASPDKIGASGTGAHHLSGWTEI